MLPVDVLSVLDGENVNDMLCGIEFVNNSISSHSQGKLTFVVARERLALGGKCAQRFYFCNDSFGTRLSERTRLSKSDSASLVNSIE